MTDPHENSEEDVWSADESGEIALRVAPFISKALLQGGGTPEMEEEILSGLEHLSAHAPRAHFTEVIARRLRAENVFHLLPARVQDRLEGDPVYLGQSVDGRRLDLTVMVRVTGLAAADLADALATRWDWWQGRVVSWREEEGRHQAVLRPGRVPLLRLGIDMAAPQIAEEISPSGEHASKTTFMTRFTGMLDGSGRHEAMEIRGGSLLRVHCEKARLRGAAALLPRRLAQRLVSNALKAGYAGLVDLPTR